MRQKTAKDCRRFRMLSSRGRNAQQMLRGMTRSKTEKMRQRERTNLSIKTRSGFWHRRHEGHTCHSDSDAPVMLGAGSLSCQKAYLTAWKIVMEQKGQGRLFVQAVHMVVMEDTWPFRTSPAPSGQKVLSLQGRYRCRKKLLVFLVLLLILPVACMARDFDGFRADVPPQDGRSSRKRTPWWDSAARQRSHCDRDCGLSPGCPGLLPG